MEVDSEEMIDENQAGERRRSTLLRKSGSVVLMVIGILLIAVFGFDLKINLPGSEPVTVAPQVDSLAPNFSLKDLNGNVISLTDLRGKNVVLNFWATWCGPCRLEMPSLQARQQQHQEDLVVLAVNFDEPEEVVQAFKAELGLSFPIVLDPGAIVQDVYSIRAYPTTYFIDREGVIRNVRIGILTEETLDDYLAELGITS